MRDIEPFWNHIQWVEETYVQDGDERELRLRLFRRGYEPKQIDRRVEELKRERETWMASQPPTEEPKGMTFKEYVHLAHAGPNARGDFLRDARVDRSMPDDFTDLDGLLTFLRAKHRACAGAIEGARAAWKTYRQMQRRRE